MGNPAREKKSLKLTEFIRARQEGAWFGGGQPLPDLFRPTIRIPLRATQAKLKRANANK